MEKENTRKLRGDSNCELLESFHLSDISRF